MGKQLGRRVNEQVGSKVQLKRMSDEEAPHYIYRICRNKDIGKYDMTWKEVQHLLNDELEEEYTESKYRKEYQAMQRGIDMMDYENTDTEEQMEEMRLLKMELEMEKKKKQTEAVYYNRILREHSRQEMIYEKAGQAIEKAELDVPEFKPLQVSKTNGEWLLGFSDMHAYKYFESITNEYNREILEERMRVLMTETIEAIELNGITELTVLNGGDSLEGMLRNSALQSLELGVVETVVEFQRWLVEWLNQLSKHVEIRYIHLISANHSEVRPLNSRAGQFPKEDMEIIIANYIKDLCETNPRITVIVPDEPFALFQMAGYNIIAHHGHKVRNRRKYVERMTRKLRVFLDYGIFGHLHHGEISTMDEGADNDCEIIGLPSIIGTDTYADSILEGAKASAVLFKFEEGKGRTQENKIVLN